MHCMVAVYDKAHYERKYKNAHQDLKNRAMWRSCESNNYE